MPGYGKSRDRHLEGLRPALAGSDGPGGRGRMFAGSEGPERASAGRYERRQTRQVLSAIFLALSAESCCESCPAAPRRPQRIGGDRRCGRRQPVHFWTFRTANEPRILKAAIWQAPGPSPPLGHYLQNVLAHTGCRRFSMGWSWGWGGSAVRARWVDGTGRGARGSRREGSAARDRAAPGGRARADAADLALRFYQVVAINGEMPDQARSRDRFGVRTCARTQRSRSTVTTG